MNFDWKMKESQWNNYMKDHRLRKDNGYSKDADVYGAVNIGKLRAEFIHTLDTSAWFPYIEIFCLDRDTGYGYKDDGRPYDLLDNKVIVPVRCKTFNSFKEIMEKRLTQEIKEQHLEEEACAEDGWK